MKNPSKLCALLLALAATGSVQAQVNIDTQLRQAATGASFKVGDTAFRLAPTAVVESGGTSATKNDTVVGGKYKVTLPASAAAAAGAAAAKTPSAPGAASSQAPSTKLAAAVSEGGAPVVVTSSLNVYFDQPSVLAEAVRATGGKLVYSSAIGGKGTIEFATVDEAIKAMTQLQGKAGVKEVSPKIVQMIDELH